ncbi:hypothetical protein AN403_6268 [Pseudomonas fluorescens]|uniref:Uncharacterized protein n=1 Tax=Pseudomonas fluorescens TaxID=294 RepID=A0A0P8XNM7_PSEFL|nr:hypothetical protein AN403_6268 [Pseudomonas fluorescens]
MAVWLTVTRSWLSRSAKLSVPLSLNVAAPSPSFIAPLASPMLSVGRSLVPVRVMVTVCAAETALAAPLSSLATTL